MMVGRVASEEVTGHFTDEVTRSSNVLPLEGEGEVNQSSGMVVGRS